MAQVSEHFTEWLELYKAAKARGLSTDDADEAADKEFERRHKKPLTLRKRRKRRR